MFTQHFLCQPCNAQRNKMAQVRLSKRYTTEIIHLRSCQVVVVVVVYVQDDARGEITGHKNTRSCLSAWKPEVSGLAFAFARRKTVRMWTFHKPQWLKFSQLNVTFLDLNPQSIVLRLQTSNNVCDSVIRKQKKKRIESLIDCLHRRIRWLYFHPPTAILYTVY